MSLARFKPNFRFWPDFDKILINYGLKKVKKVRKKSILGGSRLAPPTGKQSLAKLELDRISYIFIFSSTYSMYLYIVHLTRVSAYFWHLRTQFLSSLSTQRRSIV